MPHNDSPTGAHDVSFVPTCPACGKENFAFAPFCITCGEPLDDLLPGGLRKEQPHSHNTTEMQHSIEPPPRRASPDPRRLLRWEQAVGVALLLCTLGYVLFNWQQSNEQSDAYHKGTAAEQARDWDGALAGFTDAAGLRDAAKHADLARRNVENRDRLYKQAVAAAAQRDWNTVFSALAGVLDIEPGYRDTAERATRARAEAFTSGLDGLVYLAGRGPNAGLYLREARDGQSRTLRIPGSDKNSLVRAISPDGTSFVYDRPAQPDDFDPAANESPSKAQRIVALVRLNASGRSVTSAPLLELDATGKGVFAATGLWWFSAQPGKEILGYDTYYLPNDAAPGQATLISDVSRGKRVVALDPPHSRAIISATGERTASGNRETLLYLGEAGGTATRLLTRVDGVVLQAMVSDNGCCLLYTTQAGDYPITRAVWVLGLDSVRNRPPQPWQLETLSWSGVEMHVRLSATFLPPGESPADDLPRVLVDRVLGDSETLAVHDLRDFSRTVVWQGAPDDILGLTMSGLSHDGRYLTSRRQLGRTGQLKVVGLEPKSDQGNESAADFFTYPDQIVGAQFAPLDNYVVTSVRNLEGINRGVSQDIYSAGVGQGGALAGEPKRIAVANLPYVTDFSPTALPTAGYLLAYITPASDLRAVFLDGSGDTLVEKGVSAVWALGGRTDLGWWR